MVVNNQRAFLRSINLVYDAASAECVEHFYPTAKAIILIETIMGTNTSERSNFVVAPYGSGKSLAATYALQVIENKEDAKDVLMRVAERMQTFAGDLSEQIIKRINGHGTKRDKGIVITLHGSVRNLSNSIKKGALDSISRLGLTDKAEHLNDTNCQTIDDLQAFINDLKDFSSKHRIDHIAFIWDEFGKHLETLIAEGRSAELIEIQQLAEVCSRQQKTPFTLTLLMHQGLNNYASGLPQSVRNEWNKIAGRFREIRYVDNSKEIYQLIARIMSSNGLKHQNLINVKVSDHLQKLGLFKEFIKKELIELLNDSNPLDAISLYLLPRISARVAQNERTLFSFLNDLDGGQIIGTDSLYDYFSNEMHADISVGGTSKQWLQAESAISQCEGDPIQVKAIKCACLLGMGLLGERTKVPKELLALALCDCDMLRYQDAFNIVQILLKKKLLLHRHYNDSISVWHGTDFDIRGKLEELKTSNREQFDVVGFLNKEAPPRAWRPLRYNAKYGIRRYCGGVYASLPMLHESNNLKNLEIDRHFSDAKIIYFIPIDESEIKEAQGWAKENQEDRVGIFIPHKPIALAETALEVFCLMELSRDQKIISQDPLLPVEIAQMLDDARSYLQQLTDRFTAPGKEVVIYFGGKEWDVRTEESFNEKLSDLMKKIFHLTPIINNELIVRRNISKTIQNARKKLVMGILEHAGEQPLFNDTEIRTPQASMYRSIFLHTGLYDDNKDDPHFNEPNQKNDPGVFRVWSELKKFYYESGRNKVFSVLVDDLQRPPYGVKAALLPLLLAAGYKAFAKSVVLCGPYGYLNDLLPSTFEHICAEPSAYSIQVVSINSDIKKYLSDLAWLFSYEEESKNEQRSQADLNPKKELLRQVYEAFCKWREELPTAALSAPSVSKEASSFQQILKQTKIVPDELFLKELPKALGCKKPGSDVIKAMAEVINELTNVVSIYQKQVEQVIREAFSLSKERSLGLRETANLWGSCFLSEFKSCVPDLVGRRIFSLLEDYKDSEELFVEELALIFIGKGIIHWDTSTFKRFDEKLNEFTAKIQRMFLEYFASKDLNKRVQRDLNNGVKKLLKAEAERLKLKMIEFGFSGQEIKKIF